MDTIRIKGIGTDILLPYPAKEKSPVVIPQPVILKESFTRGLRSLSDIYGYCEFSFQVQGLGATP